MKILVTGATGFVGYHLTRSLIEDGNDIRVLVRSSGDKSELEKLEVEIFEADLLDPDSLTHAVKGCHQVYHIAGQMLTEGISRKHYFSINVEGTQNIAQASKKIDLDRFVYASSAGVHGIVRNPPINEFSAIHHTSAYRESKWRGEQIVRKFNSLGMPTVIVRLPGLMGPGSMNWLGLARAIQTNKFRIVGNGRNHDHVADIADVVDGLRLCGEKRQALNQCYHIASKDPITVNEIIETIADELDIPRPTVHLPVGPYRLFNRCSELIYQSFGFEIPGVHRYALFLANKIIDISKAEKELGFSPKVSFKDGMRKSIDWYRQKNLI